MNAAEEGGRTNFTLQVNSWRRKWNQGVTGPEKRLYPDRLKLLLTKLRLHLACLMVFSAFLLLFNLLLMFGGLVGGWFGFSSSCMLDTNFFYGDCLTIASLSCMFT